MNCKHQWNRKMVSAGPTVSAFIDICEKCGEEKKELTGAGIQQLNWWGLQGVEYKEALEKIYAGEYPWETASWQVGGGR